MVNKLLLTAGMLAAATCAWAVGPESRARYATNPDGAVGQPATISIDGEFNDWSESMIIATGGANDVATAFKGAHENCVLDLYALYAAWDDENLYVAWQMCNTGDIWAREGDGPLTDGGRVLDVPLALVLSVNPHSVCMSGLNQYGKGIWGDKASMGYGFEGDDAHVDHWLLMSGKVGNGDPSMFIAANDKGDTDYTAQHCMNFKSNDIAYKMKEGFQPAALWRHMGVGDDDEAVQGIYDEEKYFDILSPEYETYRKEHDLKPHDTKFDSFYEIKVPLAKLGIDREWLETYGITARIVATRGESAIDCLPHDPSMVDNVFGNYGSDKSTSHEKDDFDNITYPAASIGHIRGNIADIPEPVVPEPPVVDPDPVGPFDGKYTVYFRDTENWNSVNCYIWDVGVSPAKEYTGAWPGAATTTVTADNGETLYRYVLATDEELKTPMVIFNGNGHQTGDLELVNNAIYDPSGKVGELSGIDNITIATDAPAEYYNLQGVRVAAPGHGLYLRRTADGVAKVIL